MSIERGQKFFPQLTGLGNALQRIVDAPRPVHDTNKLHRADSDIQARLDKQAAKLARRAKQANK